MSEIPRDPREYVTTIHAEQRRRQRDIPKAAVYDTIATGRVQQTDDADIKLFVKHYPGDDHPIGVAANIADCDIVTVMWRGVDQ